MIHTATRIYTKNKLNINDRNDFIELITIEAVRKVVCKSINYEETRKFVIDTEEP